MNQTQKHSPTNFPEVISRLNRHWFLLGAILWIFAGSTPALGYTVYRTDKNPDIPLRWFSDTVHYEVSEVSTPDITTSALITLSQQALGAWEEATGCSPKLTFAGTNSDSGAGFAVGCDNTNVVVLIPDKAGWAQRGFSQLEIAKTTLMFSEETGEIVDADIEVNAGGFLFSSGDPADDTIDLLNTLTHEAGHFLGMDHSIDKEATMYAQAPPQEIKKRSLEDDDIEGACFLYRDYAPFYLDTVSYYDDACNPEDPTPDATGSADAEIPVVHRNHGCASTPGPTYPKAIVLLFFLFLHVIVGSRKRVFLPHYAGEN